MLFCSSENEEQPVISQPGGSISEILPHCAPPGDGARILLHAIRHMGSGGINDAHAVNALIGAFGLSFRRPLVLLRAMMAEMSRVSTRSILIAPPCCGRMTGAEAVMISAVARACDSPASAHELLRMICGVRSCLGLLSSTQAVGQAFADLGRPISAG
jgi:hypothetical protein